MDIEKYCPCCSEEYYVCAEVNRRRAERAEADVKRLREALEEIMNASWTELYWPALKKAREIFAATEPKL